MRFLLQPWVWRMAWRESRGSRRRLLLYVASIVAGVGALVAIFSFRANLEAAIAAEARALLGADLALSSTAPFDAEAERLLEEIGGRQSRQVSFDSMARFPAGGGTRLVMVRALEGEFPYYGELQTEPPSAAAALREIAPPGADPPALVEEGLLLQFDAEVGDPLVLGEVRFRIAGRLQRVAGEMPTAALVAPRVYIPLRRLEATRLLGTGSRARHTAFIALPGGGEVEALVEELRSRLRRNRLSVDTVERRKRRLDRLLSNLHVFLLVAGLAALVLGGIGVASSVHFYVRDKVPGVAVLRCLGAPPAQATAIFAVQALGMGVVGAGLGAVAGVGLQAVLPGMLSGLLPVEVPGGVSWPAVLGGFIAACGLAMPFALLPLVSLRRVRPLVALRARDERDAASTPWRRDPLRWALVALIVAATGAFILGQSPDLETGIGLWAGLAAVVLALAATGRAAMWAVRRGLPTALRYEWRQGLANLYRPRNQTLVLLLTLGLGTTMVVGLLVLRGSLLAQVRSLAVEHRANLVVWDVQPDQVDELRRLMASTGVEVDREMPIVPMRISRVGERGARDILEDSGAGWAVRWDYSSTFRDHLVASEEIVAGEFAGSVEPADRPVPVSLDRQVAEDLGIGVGDALEFDVQGVAVSAVVGSLRRVAWEREPPNFLVVFPRGVLEEAPRFHVVVGRAPSTQASAALQRRVVQQMPNVSVVDLALVLETVDGVVDEISLAIELMALLSLATGLVVLAAAVLTTRLQRVREGALLRTLGASRQQIGRILLAEYLVLGGLAALVGAGLALAGGWILARTVLDVPFAVEALPLAATAIAVTALTVGVGLLASRGICRRPPLAVLRTEVG